jgi:hypothetical protein
MGRLRDTELQLAKAQEALTDTRHELSKSKAAGKEWQKQQRLAALDLDNYRRYIKTAREKEKHFKAEMAQANKRQVAVALELAKKDDSAIELKRRIDELSKVAEETFQQQQAMQHQVSSPAPPAPLLLPRSSPLSHLLLLLGGKRVLHAGQEADKMAVRGFVRFFFVDVADSTGFVFFVFFPLFAQLHMLRSDLSRFS